MKDDIVSSFQDFARLQISKREMYVHIAGGHFCYPSSSDKACRECFDRFMRGDNARVDKQVL